MVLFSSFDICQAAFKGDINRSKKGLVRSSSLVSIAWYFFKHFLLVISLHLYPVCIGSIWHLSSTPIIFCFIFHSIHNIVTSFLRRSQHSIFLFLNIMLNLIFNLLFCYTFLRCFHDFSFKSTSFKFLFFYSVIGRFLLFFVSFLV